MKPEKTVLASLDFAFFPHILWHSKLFVFTHQVVLLLGEEYNNKQNNLRPGPTAIIPAHFYVDQTRFAVLRAPLVCIRMRNKPCVLACLLRVRVVWNENRTTPWTSFSKKGNVSPHNELPKVTKFSSDTPVATSKGQKGNNNSSTQGACQLSGTKQWLREYKPPDCWLSCQLS